MRPIAHRLVLGDAPEAWAALGFDVSDLRLGGVLIELTGEGGGVQAVEIEGLRAPEPDSLPLHAGKGTNPFLAPRRSRDARKGSVPFLAVDHLVVFTGSLDRTAGALAAAGVELRRRRDPPEALLPQGFFNLSTLVLEVAETGRDPPAFWGITLVVEDLDAAAARLGSLLGEPRPAVQPGRRIATVRPEAGLGIAMALMTPRVRTR